jgi:enoyl-CoA hydratase/carnithine racemase
MTPPAPAAAERRCDIVVTTDATGVARLTLDRPARRNALTGAMWRELTRIVAELSASDTVRVVVLTGAGDHFSAGADISEFGAARTGAAAAQAYEGDVDACMVAIAACPKPTIAAVRGFCLGGGCGLAMACDFRLADRTARFGIPAARLGIVYGIPESRLLLALVGLANAKRILFTAERFDAVEAARIGFVDQVVDGSLEEATAAFAATLAGNAPLSIAGAKLILTALAAGEVAERRAEIEAMAARADESEDFREGVRAFLEKRPPRFTGA